MRRLRQSVLTVALVAVFALPLTCICQLLQVPGLYAPAPHLLLLGEHHHDASPPHDMQAMMSDAAFSQQFDDYVSASEGKLDYVYVATDEQEVTAPIDLANGCSLAGHGADLLDVNPMLVATVPLTPESSNLVPIAIAIQAAAIPIPQFTPAPPSPPPPAALFS